VGRGEDDNGLVVLDGGLLLLGSADSENVTWFLSRIGVRKQSRRICIWVSVA
jgi:hypothetical protein